MTPGILGGLMAAFLVPLIFYLLSRVRGLRVELPEGYDHDAMTKKYQKWEGVAALLLLGLTVPFGFLLYWLLNGLARFVLSFGAGDAVYTLQPPSLFWAIPAVFLGLMLSGAAASFALRRWLGPEGYAEFTLWDSVKAANQFSKDKPKAGVNTRKTGLAIAAVMLTIVAIVLPLSLDCYTRITPTGIVQNPFLGFGEKRYAWSDIKGVKNVVSFVAPNGKPVKNPYYEVRFNDGSVWSTRLDLSAPPDEKAPEIFDYIAEKSGKPIIIEDPYPDAREVK